MCKIGKTHGTATIQQQHPQLPTPQTTFVIEPTSLDTDPPRTLPSQGELGTNGHGSEDGAEDEAEDDGEADRNLVIDWLIEVLVDLNVE